MTKTNPAPPHLEGLDREIEILRILIRLEALEKR
jgi:hypothetical protein